MATVYFTRKSPNTIVVSFRFENSKARTNFKDLEEARKYYYSHGVKISNFQLKGDFATTGRILKVAEMHKAVLCGFEQCNKMLFVTLTYPNEYTLKHSIMYMKKIFSK